MLLFVAIFVIAGLPITPDQTVMTPFPTTDPLALPLPTVPPGGTPVIVTGTYFHPSGVFSLPEIEGWNLPVTDPEELIVPSDFQPVSRAGVTLINSLAASVIHVFAERNPNVTFDSVEALNTFYDEASLAEAWVRYTGGWRELSRGVEDDTFVISFELQFEQQTYLGRQISRLDGDWLTVMRLVVPGNNLLLLDRLQSTLTAGFRIWPEALVAPLDWRTLADSGYAIRYPPDWRQTDGGRGRPYTLSGTLNGETFRLTTRAVAASAVTSEDEARAWVRANVARPTIQTVAPITRGETTGFEVSYLDADADGNRRSALVILLNGAEGTLYAATFLGTMGGRDLLAEDSAPEALATMRESFFVTGIRN